jgi:hypothetical protein
MNFLPYIISAAAAIVLAVLYITFVLKDYPREGRSFICVVAVLFFLVSALAICGVILGKDSVDAAIHEKSYELEQYITEHYPDNQLVKDGIDLSVLNEDASQSAAIVSSVIEMIPSHTELGLNKLLYDMMINFASDKLQTRLAAVDYNIEAGNVFADEQNMLTVSSLVNGLRISSLDIAQIAFYVIIGIVVLALIIFIIVNAGKSAKEKKRLQRENNETTQVS